MNIDKIKALQAVIAVQPHVKPEDSSGFNMDFMRHPCGTPSCMAGWDAFINSRPSCGTELFAESLGISHETAGELAFAWEYDGNMSDITPAQAVQALQNVIDGCDVKGVWAHLKGQS
jgi:hypothetical protein